VELVYSICTTLLSVVYYWQLARAARSTGLTCLEGCWRRIYTDIHLLLRLFCTRVIIQYVHCSNRICESVTLCTRVRCTFSFINCTVASHLVIFSTNLCLYEHYTDFGKTHAGIFSSKSNWCTRTHLPVCSRSQVLDVLYIIV
jgi:hypothetical protein